ncbi:ABC transporter substrate-binding protein [Pontibacter sp. KCTC 32443]|uniref:ABC transporter substrate-binding protein n=1 Tax=Pontibacter TaxID=323449 RepID=UPI00164ECC9A|nr:MULTISPECIES: ABC transporter substrate-binding protein [Pontibacter]MBC5774939.1 ABC transporter substrate-binding protein [Pontibacter sp. KCTC 32443]
MRKIYPLLFSLLFLLSFCSQPQRQPDEVRIRLASDPQTLSPVNYSDPSGLQVINLLFQSLLGADLADDQLKPVLVNSLPIIEQKDSVTLITYELREEAAWTNGSPVTSDDIAFTLKVLKAPVVHNEMMKPQVAFIRDLIQDKENQRKFTLVCDGYTPEMELLSGDFFILPSYLFDPKDLLKNIPVAAFTDSLSKLENNKNIKAFAAQFNIPAFNNNGQKLQGSAGYLLEKWVPGQYITLKQKENWWGKETGAPNLTASPKQITLQVIPDNTTALLATKNGQLDVLSDIPASEFDQLKSNQSFLKDYELHTPQSYSSLYVGINSRLPKFSDKKTRQAIAYLLDVTNFIKVTQQQYATPTVGIIPPNIKDYYNSDLKPYTLNTAKAKQLLQAAGWQERKNGWFKSFDGKEQQLTIAAIYKAGNTILESTALIFQQSATKLNIPVQIEAQESSLFSQNSREQNFELFFRTLTGNPFAFNFTTLLHTSFAEKGGTNYTGFGNTESDALLEAINTSKNREQKAPLLKKLQKVMQEEATFIPLYYQKERLAIHKRFGNTKVSGLKPNYDVSAFLLKK